ncbi:hypothetical protein [Caulobacter sp. 1776]|uniref:hypothetical protein n=1 Tax=Caulobacter sp. 1776 TaxID=3156420 RepID=UPI003390D6EC
MASKPRSPLEPGAYGKPQRWHEILSGAATARREKREEQRQRTEEAANNSVLLSAAAVFATLFR